MTTAPAADRVRASRLRRRPELTAEDRAWLDAYELAHPPRVTVRRVPAPERAHHPAASPPAAAPTPAGHPSPATAHDGAPAPAPAAPPSSSAPSSAASSAPEASAWRTIDFGAPQAAAIVPVEVCKIPDCPACRRAKGTGAVCVATGVKVWPPMSEEGAKAMAAAVLGVVAVLVRVGRRVATGADAPVVAPTAGEVAQLGRALREVTYRRASYMGASDDLFALAWALGAFSMRAARA